MQINGKTKHYGLIGWPVKHTFSPAMHNAAFEALGINAVYVPLAVEEKNFEAALKGLAALGFSGFNVTIPYKEKIIPYLSSAQGELKMGVGTGAVNTVVVENGKFFGYNTDWVGFFSSLEDDDVEKIKGNKVFIFGAGGAAKAVAAGIENLGVTFYITDVAKEKAENLVSRINKYSKKSKAEYCHGLENKETQEKLEKAVLVINATGIGLRESDPALVQAEWVRKEQIAYDLIYNPPRTNFLRVYKEKGAKVLNGEGMLLYQAVEAFKIFNENDRKAQMKGAVIKEAMQKALREEIERPRLIE